MVWPVVAAFGIATLITTVRVTRRTILRFRKLPPEAFGYTSHYNNPKFHYGGFEEKMDTKEAMMVLGIHDLSNMTPKELSKHHRHTMLLNHPDKGGSKYLAMKINQAHDVLKNRL